MGVPTYQIHNVMKLFSSRLQRRDSERRTLADDPRRAVPAESRRRSIDTRVTAEILQRLNRSGVAARREAVHGPSAAPTGGQAERRLAEFTYQLIDGDNLTHSATFSVQDPSFLIDRFEDLSDDGTGER